MSSLTGWLLLATHGGGHGGGHAAGIVDDLICVIIVLVLAAIIAVVTYLVCQRVGQPTWGSYAGAILMILGGVIALAACLA